MPHQIGIIGLGKIAHDQHVPSINANKDFQLIAASSQRGIGLEGVPHAFSDYRDLLKMPDLDAVAICTPPQVRHTIARDVLMADKHALLEKPPAATLSELVYQSAVRAPGECRLGGMSGEDPRFFSLNPTGSDLVAANEDSDNILPFFINQQTGIPEAPRKIAHTGSPVCVIFTKIE